MSGVLSRLTKLGLAPETLGSQGTYTAAGIVSVPFNTAKFTDAIVPLRDESVRANDAMLQGLQQGPWETGWELEVNLYSDLGGYFLRAMIGPDTVTAGVSTTLASNCAAGATSLTLSVTMPTPNIIQISDATGVNLEWVAVTVSGTTATVTTPGGTKFAHTAAGGSVISQSTHVFKQNRTFSTQWPSYSFTVDDGTEQTGWPGQVLGELAVKIDPKALVGLSAKFTGWPSTTSGVTTFSYAASAVLPAAGWAWTVNNAGASSTRGVTMDVTMKRGIEVILGSDGTQGPREVFAGAMEIDGTYKAVFDSTADKNLFMQYSQLPTTHTIAKPVQSGGESLAILMSQSGYTTGEVDLHGSEYVQLTQALSGIANSADAGIVSVTLKNYRSTAF